MPKTSKIAKQIKNARKNKNLTIRESVRFVYIASELDVSETTWRNWESGRFIPTADHFIKICIAFKLKINDFI